MFFHQVEIEGLTGEIRFNEDGRRTNYTLNVVEMTINSAMVKVAEWTEENEFNAVAAKYVRIRPKIEIERNRTYVVTTIMEEPYIIATKEQLGGMPLVGNDRYLGYCKDLADMISKTLGINCKLNLFFLHRLFYTKTNLRTVRDNKKKFSTKSGLLNVSVCV